MHFLYESSCLGTYIIVVGFRTYQTSLACLFFHAQSGGGEIRTHETLSGLPHFKCGAFNHSATPPLCAGLRFINKL